METMQFTRTDPACRRTLAKLRLRRWQMRKAGIALAIDGAPVTPAAKTDVRVTWRRHGWRVTGKRQGPALARKTKARARARVKH